MRWIIAVLAFLAAPACGHAKPKPPLIKPAPPPPLPEFADGADAAKVLEAKIAAEAARLRWFGAREEFERKYGINVAQGDGWELVGPDGKPCADDTSCRLKIRRAPPAPPPAKGVK